MKNKKQAQHLQELWQRGLERASEEDIAGQELSADELRTTLSIKSTLKAGVGAASDAVAVVTIFKRTLCLRCP